MLNSKSPKRSGNSADRPKRVDFTRASRQVIRQIWWTSDHWIRIINDERRTATDKVWQRMERAATDKVAKIIDSSSWVRVARTARCRKHKSTRSRRSRRWANEPTSSQVVKNLNFKAGSIDANSPKCQRLILVWTALEIITITLLVRLVWPQRFRRHRHRRHSPGASETITHHRHRICPTRPLSFAIIWAPNGKHSGLCWSKTTLLSTRTRTRRYQSISCCLRTFRSSYRRVARTASFWSIDKNNSSTSSTHPDRMNFANGCE